MQFFKDHSIWVDLANQAQAMKSCCEEARRRIDIDRRRYPTPA
jgi:hypothetical protein